VSVVGAERIEELVSWFRDYYSDDVLELAKRYPKEQTAIEVAYSDLYEYDATYAEKLFTDPNEVLGYLDEALRMYDLPVDIELSDAEVRIVALPDDRTHMPGRFSPKDRAGEYVGIEGEVAIKSDPYQDIVEACFECGRCGTETYIPQDSERLQEPHECQGCERQGPFSVNDNRSRIENVQKVRVQEPPERANGNARTIDVFVREDLCDVVEVGDRVEMFGVMQRKIVRNGNQKMTRMDTWLDGHAITIVESDRADIDITDEDRQRIEAYTDGEHGDLFELGAGTIAPKLVGYEDEKLAALLAAVRGARVTGTDGDDAERGHMNVLFIGDPSTGKSKILRSLAKIAPRSVKVSGSTSREAGVTASAVRDDFSDGEWTLKTGAIVRASGGIACIDELDDMDPNVRSAILEPMSDGELSVAKADIVTTLTARTGVIAAANPKYSSFDPYEPIAEQFDIEGEWLSRCDLIFTFTDDPNPDEDEEIANHITLHRETRKKQEVAPEEVDDDVADQVSPAMSPSLLRKLIASAQGQPKPYFADDSLRREMVQQFTTLRAANGYDSDDPVPVAWRKLEAVHRYAEAAARFCHSVHIERRHVEVATRLVGSSMQSVGKNEDGVFDKGTTESGGPKTQEDRIKLVWNTIHEHQDDYDEGLPHNELYDLLDGQGLEDRDKVDKTVQHLLDKGEAYEPRTSKTVKVTGGSY